MEINDNIHQMDLTDIYRTFHPNSIKYTFFSVEDRVFFPEGTGSTQEREKGSDGDRDEDE